MSVRTRCLVPPMARDLRALVCPLSVIEDLPRVVSGDGTKVLLIQARECSWNVLLFQNQMHSSSAAFELTFELR